jgi:hypothetical protein
MYQRIIEVAVMQNFAPAYTSQSVPNYNGRIDLMSPLPALNIPDYQKRSIDNSTFTSEALTGQVMQNNLSQIFFSARNIDALHEGIRYRIYMETGGQQVIGRQSDTELKIVMRSMYYQYAKHDNRPVVEQVRELNGYVLDWVVPEVLSNLKQYMVYKRDASTLPVPLERAQLSTMKGTKVLEIKSFM